ncbi:Holliday junction resolvase RecU [Solibacillus sp. FSL H8-0523]|uniref:Holliday junction resolvase RecU n=1 Tax=Solibacillus sp. FSL H8-0523 TaxID=2954511 RepID=UPI003100C7BB
MTYSRSHANRGAFLERVIDLANNKYRSAGLADINKIPTPVKITEDYGRMVKGCKEKALWVDYCGIYNGTAVIFDAKQTSGTNFPLVNLEQHQYNLLKSWSEKGAVAFLIVYFSKYDKYYYLPFHTLKWARERAESGGRKSISYEEFQTMAQEVRSKDGYTLHYLEAV